MPIDLITGPANAGKAGRVLDAVRGHLAGGAEPLLVLPTDADRAFHRRALAEQGIVAGVRVERFEGLLAEIVRCAGRGEAALGEFARERALAALAREASTREARVSPELARALARLVAELQVARVSPKRLRESVAAWTASSGAQPDRFGATLCEVFERYMSLLRRGRRADRELRAMHALDELRCAPARWGGRPVLLYGFDSFTELELDAIETLGGPVEASLTVSLAYEPGRVAFAAQAEVYQRLRPLVRAHVELEAPSERCSPASRTALHHLERSLFEQGSPRVPAGSAVRLLEGATLRAELELVGREIAALIAGGMPAEEIAIVHRAPADVAGLLAEVLDDLAVPHSACPQERAGDGAVGRALLGAMRCAGAGGRLGDLLAWLRAPGVLDYPELADSLEARALRAGVQDAARARELWEQEHWPLERLDRLREAAQAHPRRLIALLKDELERLFCAPHRRRAPLLDGPQLREARAMGALRGALDELDDLARWAPELTPGLDELAEALAALASPPVEQARTGRVLLTDPLGLGGRSVRALFLCGLQEGVFPARTPSPALLGEQERRELARASGLALPRERDRLAVERGLLYALSSRPTERLALSWHATGEDGSPSAPSLFLDDLCEPFEEGLREQVVRAGAASLPELPGEEAPIAPLRDGTVLADLRGRATWSASSLERWAGCPVRWLVERLLRLEGLAADSEPLARGVLAHAVLRETFEGLREQSGSARLTPARATEAKRLAGEALERHAPGHLAALDPARAKALARRLRADLERYLDQAAQAESPLEPTYFEIEFGEPDAADGLAALELGEGVSVRGRIDRVDVGPSGEAAVYDYKGRSATPSARWTSEGTFQVALYMAAAERLLGVRAVGGFYQPLSGSELRPRGLLDGDGGVELPCVRTDRRPHEEAQELLEQCRGQALEAVAEARTGALEPRPGTCGHDGRCMYPEICRCPC